MRGDSLLPILKRLIDPEQGSLPPSAAEAILKLEFPDADRARTAELAIRSNRGTLTPPDADEYDDYILAADVLSIWKFKARISLNPRPVAEPGLHI